MRVIALALVCLGLPGLSVSNGPHVAQAACRSSINLKQFVVLAEAYRAGDDSPVSALADCPTSLRDIRDELLGNRALVAKARTPAARYNQLRLTPKLVPAATMLLFDSARQVMREGRPDFRDYLGLATVVLQVPRDATDTFAGEWVAAVARWLRVQRHIPEADQFLSAARQWLPGNARVIYESGVTAELLATAYARQGRTRDAEKVLENAAEWLRPLLTVAPMSDLAHIRLAHVLLLQGKTADVVPLADGLTARDSDPAIAYLASMLSGAALEREGNLRGAALRYQLAIARFSPGQSARVALSEVLRRDGRTDEARVVVETLLDRREDVREPWWTLMLDSELHVDDLLGQLRTWVRQ